MATKNNEQTLTPRAARFQASRARLASLDVSEHEFCCETHQQAFLSIQERAASTESLTLRQVDFARMIIKGETSHGSSGTQDPERMVKAWCVELIEGTYMKNMGEGVMPEERTGRVPCGVELNGTALEIGAMGTKCPEHQTKKAS